MFKSAVIHSVANKRFHREIGRYGGSHPGPLVVCIGGIHGNEPAGALALENVLHELHNSKPPFKGTLIALAGNVASLNRGVRYQHRDLNRMWKPERVNKIKDLPALHPAEAEESEQQELLARIETALAGCDGQAIFLDLHTTSSEGSPFVIISDTLINRRFALALGVPMILGLEENLDGTILNYINELGHAAIGFEAGQHRSPDSLKNHEAAVWVTLVTSGCLDREHLPGLSQLRRQLKRSANGVPQIMEMRYRHGISEADQFDMKPGFANFTPVTKGELVASDRQGQVIVPEKGLLFMPLYQKQGDDGFFLVREVKPIWLRLSSQLRRWKFDRLLPWLPGVHTIPGSSDSLIINTKIARWFVIEICHLLGFRKHWQKEGVLIVGRRRQSPAN